MRSATKVRVIFPRRSAAGRSETVAAGVILLLAMLYRLALLWSLPVAYDEIFVVAVGLLEMLEGGPRAFLEVPFLRSTGLGPLWWWLEWVPTAVWGDVTLFTLRLWPTILSPAILILSWRLARRRFGRRIGLIFLFLAATSDVLAFCTVRADFFESLLLLFFVPALLLVGDWERWRLKGVLWALMPLTFMGKGLFLLGWLALAEGVIWFLYGLTGTSSGVEASRRLKPAAREVAVQRALATLTIAVVPTFIWLGIGLALFKGQTIHHEATDAADVLDLLWQTTANYAEIKAHVVGTPGDAAQVWLDGDAWPTTAMTLGPMFLALLGGILLIGRGLARSWTRRRRLAVALTVWVSVSAALVMTRGYAGARFHLLYLPPLWLLAALVFSQRGGLARLWQAKSPILTACLVAAIFLAAMPAFAWNQWTRGEWSGQRAAGYLKGWAGGLLVVGLFWRWRMRGRPFFWMFLGLMTSILLLLEKGPLLWAPAARFEPMFTRGETPPHATSSLLALDAYRSGASDTITGEPGTLEIYLCNYYLSHNPSDSAMLQRAEHYARRALADQPDSPQSWTYWGLVLERKGTDSENLLHVWEEALRLKPESTFLLEKWRGVQLELSKKHPASTEEAFFEPD